MRAVEKEISMNISVEKFAEIFNREFGPPFLEEGHARAVAVEDGSLKLFIGRRDVHLAPDGTVKGAGTGLCAPVPDIEED